MATPQFVDISVYQPETIDWTAYRAWAASFDGIARVSLRSSYGAAGIDAHFEHYRAGALAAGVDIIIFYHYALPQESSASQQADWQRSVVGAIREHDVLMLDYEEDVPQATAAWAYEWLSRQEANYGSLPTIYASDNYVRTRLQDSRLAKYPLTVANWQFHPTERPAPPPPWASYTYLQYSDKATGIPGIAAAVDADIYLGTESAVQPAPQPQQGGSVFELKNFVMVPERTPITADGHPPENAGLSCVPASICAGAMFLNGVQHIGGVYTPDSFKDQVYGQGTVGGENVDPYVPYLKTLGINLSSFKGNSAQLVAEAHKAIQAAMPVVFIEPNPYGNPQYTHCCVFFGEQPGFLTCLDPWIAQPVTHSDATWEQTLLMGEVWTMEKITIALPDHLKQAGWQWDGHTLLCPTPHNTIPITGTWAEHILTRAIPWRVDDYPVAPPQSMTLLEGSNPKLGAGTVFLFRFQPLEVKAGDTKVFDMSVGTELAWLRSKFADAMNKNDLAVQQIQKDQVLIQQLQTQLLKLGVAA